MPVVSSLARRFSGGDGAPLSLLVYVAEVLKAAQEHRHSVWGAVERQRVAHVAAVTDALRTACAAGKRSLPSLALL